MQGLLDHILDQELDLPTLEKNKVVLDKLYLHEPTIQRSIRTSMSQFQFKLLWSFLFGGWEKNFVPMNDLKDYVGEKQTLFISWLIHYTGWLLVPFAGGLVLLAV